MDLPSELVLEAGEKAALRLDGHGSAGYLWTARLGEPGGVVRVSVSGAPAPPRPAGQSRGGSVDEVLAVEALGQHDIRVTVTPARS